MIDTSSSLEAAKGISGRDLLAYLDAEGWTAKPSKVDGMMILSKQLSESHERAEFIVPIKRGFRDEERRIADALRTIAQIQGRSAAQIARSVKQAADH
jgi:aryl-alcohol dehydrogenase-like predicted oxidoreductase